MAVTAADVIDLMGGTCPVHALAAAMATHTHGVLLAYRGIGSSRERDNIRLARQIRKMLRPRAMAGFTTFGCQTVGFSRAESAGMQSMTPVVVFLLMAASTYLLAEI